MSRTAAGRDSALRGAARRDRVPDEVPASLRLSIDGPGGRVDLVAPAWADVRSVARAYAGRTRTSGTLVLGTSIGEVLDPSDRLEDLGLGHGDLLFVLGSEDGSPGMDASVDEPRSAAPPATPVLVAGLAIAGLSAAAAVASTSATTEFSVAVAAIWTVFAVVLCRAGRTRDSATWISAVPAFGLAAGVAASVPLLPGPLTGPGLGRSLVDLVPAAAIGALGAFVAAAVGRALAPRVADEALGVWLFAGASTALLGGIDLATGAGGRTLWPLLVVLAVASTRIVPGQAVSVPDHVLLDFRRLAVTAWSARQEPHKIHRGSIRSADVRVLASRASRLVHAATFAACLVVVPAAVVSVLTAGSPAERLGALLGAGAAGVALCLGARALRDRYCRIAQSWAGAAVLGFVAARVLTDSGSTWSTSLGWAAIGVGALLVVIAAALGRGWRSVWWARAGEIVDLLAVLVLCASAVAATGLWDVLRSLGS